MFDKDFFIAGFFGSITYQILHPFDVLRTRMQSIDKSKFNNIKYKPTYRSLIKEMIRKEGVWSLYRGTMFTLSVNVFLGFFFMLNNKFGKILKSKQFFVEHEKTRFFLSSFTVSFFFASLYNPLYVIKTWILLDVKKFDKALTIKSATL